MFEEEKKVEEEQKVQEAVVLKKKDDDDGVFDEAWDVGSSENEVKTGSNFDFSDKGTESD